MIARMKTLGIDQWDASDRLELLSEIWNSLSADQIPLSAAQNAEIDRRLKDAADHPDDDVSWGEAKAEALAKLKR